MALRMAARKKSQSQDSKMIDAGEQGLIFENRIVLKKYRIDMYLFKSKDKGVLQAGSGSGYKAAATGQDQPAGYDGEKIEGRKGGMGRTCAKNKQGDKQDVQLVLEHAKVMDLFFAGQEINGRADGRDIDTNNKKEKEVVRRDDYLLALILKKNADAQKDGIKNDPQQEHPQELAPQHFVER